MKRVLIISSIFFLFTIACKEQRELPTYGKKVVDGKTITQQVPAFQFVDQTGANIQLETVKDKIFVADFFFTKCPSICPIMTKNMKTVYEEFKDNDNVKILSVSIDPKRDTVQQLNHYATKAGINDNHRWHFLTGEHDDIYDLAAFFSILAYEDSTVPGGFEHNGYFVLVDDEQYIRGYYDGTRSEEIPKLIEDINLLLDGK